MKQEKAQIVKSSFWTIFFNSPTERFNLGKNLLTQFHFFIIIKKRIKTLTRDYSQQNLCSRGIYFFLQSDPGIGLYIVREGEVEIRRKGASGKEYKLANFVKSDFF
ncbi:MAG: hypothetical protein ACUVRG_01985 [Ignavibacterium sp.]|uniref:hypothetical protein n=1 Tax=Ignavibacterium sp. TaxID=2651167 RepID=UPI00404B10E6